MEDKKSNMGKIIAFSLIFLIIGGVAGYFIGLKQSPNNFNNQRGNFQQLDEATISQITSFFENAPTSEEVNSYCQQNQRYCIEYCRNINPNNEFCSNISLGGAGYKGNYNNETRNPNPN
jgi:hypothetical protein